VVAYMDSREVELGLLLLGTLREVPLVGNRSLSLPLVDGLHSRVVLAELRGICFIPENILMAIPCRNSEVGSEVLLIELAESLLDVLVRYVGVFA